MCLLQTAIKEQETRAAQLLKEAQAERAAAGRVHTAAQERASADLQQRLDALTSAQQQEIARLEVRLLLPGPLCPERCALLSRSSFSLKLTSACSTSCAQQLSASLQNCLTHGLCPHKACIAWCVTSVQAEPEILHVHSMLSWHRAGSADTIAVLV